MAHPALAGEVAVRIVGAAFQESVGENTWPRAERFARDVVARLAAHDPPLLICYPDEIKEADGDPTGTPAVTDLSCRIGFLGDDLPDWVTTDQERWIDRSPGGTRIVLVDSHSTCGPAGRQEFPGVAVVFQLDSPNPGLLIRCPTTVGLTEKIVAFVKTRPWEG